MITLSKTDQLQTVTNMKKICLIITITAVNGITMYKRTQGTNMSKNWYTDKYTR